MRSSASGNIKRKRGKMKALGLHSMKQGYRVSSKNHGKKPKVGCPARAPATQSCPIRRYDCKNSDLTLHKILIILITKTK